MLSIRLICVGKLREQFYVDAFAEYSKRLSAYCKFECIELNETKLRINELAVSGRGRLCFVVGGSFGLSPKIKQRADMRLGMSEMTFPHHLARVMLAEQIYRSFKILEGSRYHK